MNELEKYADYLPTGYLSDVAFWTEFGERKRQLREQMARRKPHLERAEREWAKQREEFARKFEQRRQTMVRRAEKRLRQRVA